MNEEIPVDGANRTRSALGDVTNQVGKRGFSFISSDGFKKGEGFQFAKKECLRVDESKKENYNKEIGDCVLWPHSCSEIDSVKGNIVATISKVSCEIKETCPQDVRQNANSSTDLKAGYDVRDSCPSDTNGPHVVVEVEENEGTDSVVLPQIASKGKAECNLVTDDEHDVSLDNLDSSKDEYLDCSRLPESQESRCDLERCIGQRGDGFSSTCMDLIKACPCSFCVKAAYLWSDLHYQDIKGRIAAIKKSQKEASILVHQNSKDGASGRYGQGSFEKFSNLESDLTGRWCSLFLHMEDIFVKEGTQLETSLSTLKELRDNCKTDLEKK